MIRIYGASDDLVEVEGDHLEDEFSGGSTVTIKHVRNEKCGSCDVESDHVLGGLHVRMTYADLGEGGVWTASVAPIDEDVPIPWPVRILANGYTAIVEIQTDPKDDDIKIDVAERSDG